MTWRTLRKRASALTMAAVLTVTLTLPAAAAEAIGDGVTPTYDEAYYATLDYYGNLLEGSVVKSYALNGKDSLMDYGVYDEVVNLTDGTAPAGGTEGEISFHFSGDAPDHFYFEGKTKQPFEDLPWTVTLHYTLNGVPAKAEDLAGQQGVVEILLDIVPNENTSSYARYNYTLAATALFNQDDILSLEAEGAQIQLVGNLRTVLFLCLPGEEQHFTIRVGSNDFSFGGLTVLMVPATLAQLEEIAKLSQRKDDLEEDYRALSGSLDNLLDALNDIQNGLYASARGLDQLELARRTFSGGKGVLYDGVDKLRGDLSNLGDLLEPVEERVQLLSQTVTSSKTVLNEMVDATVVLQGQLAELEDALYGLERGTYDLKNVIRLAADMESSLLRLESALGGSHVSTGSVATNSRALVEQVKNVHGAYASTDVNDFMLKMLKAQGVGDAQAAAQVASVGKLMAAINSGALSPDQLSADQKAALATAEQMQNLHEAAKQGMHFQDFCEQLPGVSKDQAKQMNDLWLIYNSGGSTSGRNRAPAPAAPAAPTVPEESQNPPQDQNTQDTEIPEVPTESVEQETEEENDAEVGETGQDQEANETAENEQPENSEESSTENSAPQKGHTADVVSTDETILEEDGGEELTALLVTNSPEGEGDNDGDSSSGGGGDSSSGSGGDSSSGSGGDSSSGSGGDSSSGSGGDSSGSSGGDSSSGSGGDSSSGIGGDSSGGSGGDSSSGSGGDSSSGGGGGGSSGSGGDSSSGIGGDSSSGIGGDSSSGSGGDRSGGGGGDSSSGSGGDSSSGIGGDSSSGGGEGSSGGDTSDKNDTVGGAVVDLISSGLDSASARIDAIQSQLMSTLNAIERPTSVVVGRLADLCGELDYLVDDLDDAEDLMAALRESSGTLRKILEDTDGLRTVLNDYEPTLQEALANAGTLSTTATVTIRDTESLIADAENLARSTGTDLDAGTKQSLAGLSAALRQTAKALAATGEVKAAKNTITDIIEDTWNEYTGDVNNLLLMDATAEPVSLTDSRNPAPTSIQVLIRTQEIKEPALEEDEEAATAKAKTTFWGRIAQMFKDFWATATGIFH